MSAVAIAEEFCRDDADCIRVVTLDGQPWFVAADVAMTLGLVNHRSSLALLDEDERGVHTVDTLGGPQLVTVISESGLYSLILRSRKAEARAFRRWVTSEVLPTIRRTGAYSTGQPVRPALPRTYAEALRELAATVERAEAAEAATAVLEPRAQAWDGLASSGADYSAREAAAILGRAGIGTGQNRLLDTLRDLGMVDGRGKPYARHARHLRLKPVSYYHPYTGVRTPGKPQIRVTVEGLAYLHRKLGGRQPLEIEAKP
ncbi:phage antirepressor [Saccharothrix texasensis]|uniref:Phage antirepressor protein KilAC domain-containing protein n=1 Tax=Saccharothrix texasensis TaxID=103734 RepID=A0A3N1HDX4_9PSEU|nr:BRO family protein [Saccharothrix texasensis]ROP40705.1 phage antirepressor protein KilAC domain-containing protein [Saccharothrix texasensis]